MKFFITALLSVFFSILSLCLAETPPGFVEYEVKKDDVLQKIAPREHWDIIERVNRIDPQHLIIGKKILIPANLERASAFLPVPEETPNASASRWLIVYLDLQYFGAYEGGRLKFWGPVSSGKTKFETPPGNYKMLWKSKRYISKKYDMPMPYAINYSPDGYFMHQQSLPGRPASHGCIRLRVKDAKAIFEWIEKNDPITLCSKGT